MAITSSDILNLSHSLKDICEVNCNTPECLSQTLKILLQYNLIQANLQYMLRERNNCRLPSITDEHDRDADAIMHKTINPYAHEHNRQSEKNNIPPACPADTAGIKTDVSDNRYLSNQQ